jgi:hypothetical protein
MAMINLGETGVGLAARFRTLQQYIQQLYMLLVTPNLTLRQSDVIEICWLSNSVSDRP